MRPRARGGCGMAAGLAAAALLAASVLVAGVVSSASAEGVIVRGASIAMGAVGEQVPLPGGRLLDVRRLVAGAPLPPHDAHQLLVHDLDAGTTVVASADLGLRALVGRDDGVPTYLAALLVEPGDVVVYDAAAPRDGDALAAERFIRSAAGGGGGFFYADPGTPVPEPGLSGALAIGFLSLLRRRRSQVR